jgi:acetylornithine deacetylase
VDPLTCVRFARALIDIDSTTGREQQAGTWLAAQLEQLGYVVDRMPVAAGRFNVYAHVGDPVVVLSTHYDCVPPFIPSRVESATLHGRGACDAKGILAAQVAAVERLRASGERRVALLFVVGEERGSDGAATANASAPGSRYLINGEPTDSRLGIATRGILRIRLGAQGRAAHSATPDRGVSAIDILLDALMKFRTATWPSDADLGSTFYSIGLIEGGIAPNVISPSASAELMFRLVGPADDVLDVARAIDSAVRIEEVLRVPMVRLRTIEGFPAAVFPFTTDIPLLDNWGSPLLFGPGSILVAHTADEHVQLDELERAIDAYVALARRCLSGAP